jgi:hypothetical protein
VKPIIRSKFLLLLQILGFPGIPILSSNVWGQNKNIASAAINSNSEKIIIEDEDSRVTYYRGSAFDHYKGGKRYGMITLHNGAQIIGFLEAQQNILRVYGNPDYDDIKLNQIADIKWLNQVLIKRMSGEIIVGHLVREDRDNLTVETLGNPKTILTIEARDIESKTIVRDAQFARKRISRPRIALLGGSLFAIGAFRDLFRNGIILGLSFQQNFSRIFNTESYWFPDLRVDLSGISFQNNGFNYQSAYINAGPMWILNGVFEHKGIISVGFLPGIAFERASSPLLPEGTSGYTFTFQGALSYEYPIWRRLYVGLDLRGLYSLDPNNPLIAAGAALRISYQF